FMWVRATYPHVRSDQLMWVCWKIFMPLAILNTFITAIVLVF
ncbi:MAG: NADH-quinone oxidoreductase subunit H, partial [Helicobacter sp.]|nr:NADH-quinone oxidoreductase subunit H [Helicobacter sp.]